MTEPARAAGVRVVSESCLSAETYRSLARYRQSRGWWLRDGEGNFVDLGGFAPAALIFDRTLSLGPGEYVLGCGPAGSGGLRQTVRVGPLWTRGEDGPDGHFVLMDSSGGVSVGSESGCWVFGLSADVFGCATCGSLYRLVGLGRRGRSRRRGAVPKAAPRLVRMSD